ncbi:MAG: phage tail sheath subtilisin-like domain-containing protein [Desulfobacteraceae bacterium]|nr:phage tail sheath subtilisin-like domain-containing protein [Desulfobacteraceae bacterium]
MSSPNVTFSQIPAGVRKPGQYLEFNTSNAVSTLPANAQRMLIIAQRLAAGTVAALLPTKVFSSTDAANYFGSGSMAHLMVRTAIAENPYLDLTVCALDDAGAGAAATGTITITGPATGPGILDLYIGSRRIEIAIASADAATAIAAALNTAIGAIPDLPVTAGVALGVVTLTARHKGLVGNQISLTATVTAAGVAAAVVAMAAGATDPDITTALAKVYASQYDKIATPYNDQTSLTALRTHLESVAGPLEQRPGCGVYAITGSLASATTLAGQLNEGRLVGALLRGTISPAYEIAAALAAVWCREPDPARPLNTLPLVTIAPPAIDQRLSRTEQESCLANGVTPLEVGPGEMVQIVRLITTYTLNPQGIADVALLDATTITSLDYTRLAVRTRIALRFPRSKISIKGKTPERVRGQILDVLHQLESLEILDNVDAYKAQLIVEKDSQNVGQLNARIPANVVPGLHVFAAVIDLYL